jgi:hypothetical protein
VHWDLSPRLRVDLVAFSGLNLSGERRVVEVHAVGGRKGDLEPADLRSLAFLAPVGTRLILATSDSDDGWEQHPWRCIQILAGRHALTKEGRPIVRVPDLDWLDPFDAHRSDPDFQATFDEVPALAAGTGWTFGRPGALKGMVRRIRIEPA